MALASERVSVLIGPTCGSCETDDLRSGDPGGSMPPVRCLDCGTEYRWYNLPARSGGEMAETTPLTPCPLCGLLYDAGDDHPFCEDCELADCAYCGIPTNRPFLSENLACERCEGGEAA